MVSDFDAIYQEYGKTVYCFLLSLSRDETLSEELTQETMFRAIMNISSFRGDSKISVWLCQIAKNLYLEWMKKNKRIVPIDESIDLYDSGRDIAAELADKDISPFGQGDMYHLSRFHLRLAVLPLFLPLPD